MYSSFILLFFVVNDKELKNHENYVENNSDFWIRCDSLSIFFEIRWIYKKYQASPSSKNSNHSFPRIQYRTKIPDLTWNEVTLLETRVTYVTTNSMYFLHSIEINVFLSRSKKRANLRIQIQLCNNFFYASFQHYA
jgi:hypothetical protein